MTKKTTIISAVIVIVIVACIVGFVFVKNAFRKYPLNGTISECQSNGKIIYQYVSNVAEAKPLHFNDKGDFIPCIFNGNIPSEECKLTLASLKACHIIYRTPNSIDSQPAMYKAGADEALKAFGQKVR